MTEKPVVGMDVLLAAIACCNAWEPQVRLIGNVRAVELGDLLRELLDRRNADLPALSLYPGCGGNDTGYHRLDVDGFCSDCDRLIASSKSGVSDE